MSTPVAGVRVADTSRRGAQEVVRGDLAYICDRLGEELPCLAGKRLLITGGAGFLGYYLVQSVLHWNRVARALRPIDVTVYDNFVRGAPGWLKTLADTPHFRVVQHDITAPLPADVGQVHYILHAAGIASPTYYRKYPIETMDANVNGLRTLLEYARGRQCSASPVEGLLFFSSSEIYGDPTPENIPTPETYRGSVSCTGPRACYDEAKRYGETLCVNFARHAGIPVKMARPFNNYGPGLKISDRRVLPDFARDVVAGRDIVMLSDGSPTRTFCYVADAVVGYYKILIRGQSGEAYNIGVEQPEISVAGLAERVVTGARRLFGYTGKVVQRPSQDRSYLRDNPQRRCPVIAKARADLGYEPSISFEEGLERSLIWYYENREAPEA
jgi:nucleoside-diphosphate-sugar epimerase